MGFEMALIPGSRRRGYVARNGLEVSSEMVGDAGSNWPGRPFRNGLDMLVGSGSGAGFITAPAVGWFGAGIGAAGRLWFRRLWFRVFGLGY